MEKTERLRREVLGGVETQAPVDRAFMARTFAVLFGAGGTLVLATMWIASTSNRFLPGMVVASVGAYGVVALTLTRGERLPLWVFRALPAFGAVLVTIVAYSSGTGSFNAYALLYGWVIVSAFYFFPWWQAAPSLVLCVLGYAVVLLHHNDADDRVLYWIMGMGSLVVTGGLIALLRERIQELMQELRKTDLLKTTIIRSVSHDFRTPLTAIIAAGESSASETLDARTRREASSIIVSEASRLSETLGKLLDMSRLEAGAVTPHRTWCAVEEVVDLALDRTQARERFEVTANSPLPAVWADAAQLEQALYNIFENASHFGGDELVQIKQAAAGATVTVRVSDRGPGLTAEEREQIFEPFYRDLRNGHGGPGLGLAIARGFVETNGGRIWAESTPGEGATFVVELPVDTGARAKI